MKNIIYSKYSNERADWFKIRTDILENENGQKYVQKIALTKEANNHIDNIYEHYKNLSQLYANTKLSINKCFKIKNNKLEFEYIEGRTLEEELDELLVKKDFINLVERIKDFINVIKSVSQNDSFKVTEDFIKVFGNVNLPVSLKASSINDIDLVFHNIIVKDENWNVIDYEWTFNFLIPTNFIIYRTLYYFIINSSRNDVIKDLNLYKIFNITDEEINQYRYMEINFQNYILGNTITVGYIYTKIPNSSFYLYELMSYKKSDNEKKSVQVFYDYGEGIKEENSYYLKLDNTKDSTLKFEIPVKYGLKNLRIDPASESCLVKIENLLIESQEYSQANFVTNGNFINQNTIIYVTEDPQLTLYNFPEEIKNVLIEFEVKLLSKDVAIQISKILSERNLLIEKSKTLTEQLNELKHQKDVETLALINQKKDEIKRLSLQKDNEINSLLSQKDNEINLLLLQKDNEINSLLSQKDNEINLLLSQKESLTLEIHKNENQIKHLKELIESNNLKVSELSATINDKEEYIVKQARENSKLKKNNELLNNELNDFKTHYNAAINQREKYKEDFNNIQNMYNEISNSASWKATKPVRIILDSSKKVLKSNKYTHNICKGIKCLNQNGLKYTINKVKDKIDNKASYKNFILSNILSQEELENQKNFNFDSKIKFSILVPLYNTPEKFLREMIESVISQTYSNWELCLADGSDIEHSNVEKICLGYSKSDSRIIYKKLEKNLGISDNTNVCIDMSSGDYIGLFDHDDLLHPSVLYENMIVIDKEHPDYIYTDEATFEGEISNIITMHFKPDFAVDNLRANNYICHFSVFKKELLSKCGRFNKEFDGSQDHDLILRLTEKAEYIVHIPKILYYWRSHPNSVAADINSKTYAIDAGKRAVAAHLKRCNLEGTIESTKAFPTIFRIKYSIKSNDLISIIIPNSDHIEDLKICIDSILEKSTYKNFEIIIVENNSIEDKTFKYYEKLKAYENIKIVIWKGKFNYSAINNFGVSESKGNYILLLNNDTEVITPEWIEELLMYAQRDNVGAVGAKLYYEDDTIQHAGIVLGLGADRVAGHTHYKCHKDNLGYMGRLFYAQDVTAVTAACMMLKKDVYKKVNGLDENFEVAFNDVDLCMKIRKENYLIVFNPYAELYHYESKTRGLENTLEKKERFNKEVSIFKSKWSEELKKGDPYYNPNFSLDKSDFSI